MPDSWPLKEQAHRKQGDFQIAFLHNSGVSLSQQQEVTTSKLHAAKCTSAPRGRTAPRCHGQLPPSSVSGVVAALARRRPSAGAAPRSPVQRHPRDRAGREWAASLLSVRNGRRRTVIQVKIKVRGARRQNRSQS